HADQRRHGLPHATRRWRRDDVPRAEVPKDPHGDGPLPAREPRALTIRRALAPRRAPPPHRRLDGSVAAGEAERDLYGAVTKVWMPLLESTKNLERTREAQRFLARYFEPTRLLATDIGTARVYLKLECEPPTGSFKVRGALYSLWANC